MRRFFIGDFRFCNQRNFILSEINVYKSLRYILIQNYHLKYSNHNKLYFKLSVKPIPLRSVSAESFYSNVMTIKKFIKDS